MDLVKKNIISIICGVIALLAIAAVFWPISGMFEDLQQRAEGRRQVHSGLDTLLKKQRNLPTLDLASSEPRPLEMFPTESALEKGRAATEAMKKEADRMLETAVRINKADKELLAAGALPGSNRVAQNNFRNAYKTQIDPTNASAQIVKLMQAGMRPREQEILAETKRVEDYILTNELARDAMGREVNRPQVDAKLAQIRTTMGDQMRAATASQIKVYLEPGSLDVQPQIEVNPSFPPSPSAVFWAQIGFWIQRDIAKSIGEVNANAKSVADATVKQVEKIEIPDQFASPVAQAQTSDPYGGGGDVGMAPPADPNAPITKSPGVSPTGRSSNGLYDPVHFRVRLICDAERVPAVLTALAKNKFITIFQANMETVDSGVMQAQGFYFGMRPVVRLDLMGEALFMRAWTEALMPQQVKQILGIVEQPPAQ